MSGYYENGAIVDFVAVQIPEGPMGRPQWFTRSFSHSFEDACTEYHGYILREYLIPSYAQCIGGVMGKAIDIVLQGIEGDEADEEACDTNEPGNQESGKQHHDGSRHSASRNVVRRFLYRAFCNSSQYVLFRLARAFDELTSLESDDLIHEVANGIDRVVFSAQQDATAPKDFEFDEQTKTLYIRLQCSDLMPDLSRQSASLLLIARKPSISENRHSVDSIAVSAVEAMYDRCFYTEQQYVNMIKYAGLFHSREYALDMFAASMQLDKYTSDLEALKFIIGHIESAVWDPNQDEIRAFSTCHDFIYRVASIAKSAVDPDEKVLRSWHIVLFNNQNMALERVLTLTSKAYYIIPYDFNNGKIDEKGVRRHDLDALYVLDAGSTLLNIVTRVKKESRLTSLLRGKRKSSIMVRGPRRTYSDIAHSPTKLASPLKEPNRKSHGSTDQPTLETDIANSYLKFHSRKRFKAIQQEIERPSTVDNLSEIITAFDSSKCKEIIREIAWTLYGCAVHRTGVRGYLPFEDLKLSRPKGSVHSFIYNKLRLGVTTNTKSYQPDSIDWIEMINPLYRTEVQYDDDDDDSIEEVLYSLKLQDINLQKAANYKVQMRIGGGTEGSIYLALDKVCVHLLFGRL